MVTQRKKNNNSPSSKQRPFAPSINSRVTSNENSTETSPAYVKRKPGRPKVKIEEEKKGADVGRKVEKDSTIENRKKSPNIVNSRSEKVKSSIKLSANLRSSNLNQVNDQKNKKTKNSSQESLPDKLPTESSTRKRLQIRPDKQLYITPRERTENKNSEKNKSILTKSTAIKNSKNSPNKIKYSELNDKKDNIDKISPLTETIAKRKRGRPKSLSVTPPFIKKTAKENEHRSSLNFRKTEQSTQDNKSNSITISPKSSSNDIKTKNPTKEIKTVSNEDKSIKKVLIKTTDKIKDSKPEPSSDKKLKTTPNTRSKNIKRGSLRRKFENSSNTYNTRYKDIPINKALPSYRYNRKYSIRKIQPRKKMNNSRKRRRSITTDKSTESVSERVSNHDSNPQKKRKCTEHEQQSSPTVTLKSTDGRLKINKKSKLQVTPNKEQEITKSSDNKDIKQAKTFMDRKERFISLNINRRRHSTFVAITNKRCYQARTKRGQFKGRILSNIAGGKNIKLTSNKKVVNTLHNSSCRENNNCKEKEKNTKNNFTEKCKNIESSSSQRSQKSQSPLENNSKVKPRRNRGVDSQLKCKTDDISTKSTKSSDISVTKDKMKITNTESENGNPTSNTNRIVIPRRSRATLDFDVSYPTNALSARPSPLERKNKQEQRSLNSFSAENRRSGVSGITNTHNGLCNIKSNDGFLHLRNVSIDKDFIYAKKKTHEMKISMKKIIKEKVKLDDKLVDNSAKKCQLEKDNIKDNKVKSHDLITQSNINNDSNKISTDNLDEIKSKNDEEKKVKNCTYVIQDIESKTEIFTCTEITSTGVKKTVGDLQKENSIIQEEKVFHRKLDSEDIDNQSVNHEVDKQLLSLDKSTDSSNKIENEKVQGEDQTKENIVNISEISNDNISVDAKVVDISNYENDKITKSSIDKNSKELICDKDGYQDSVINKKNISPENNVNDQVSNSGKDKEYDWEQKEVDFIKPEISKGSIHINETGDHNTLEQLDLMSDEKCSNYNKEIKSLEDKLLQENSVEIKDKNQDFLDNQNNFETQGNRKYNPVNLENAKVSLYKEQDNVVSDTFVTNKCITSDYIILQDEKIIRTEINTKETKSKNKDDVPYDPSISLSPETEYLNISKQIKDDKIDNNDTNMLITSPKNIKKDQHSENMPIIELLEKEDEFNKIYNDSIPDSIDDNKQDQYIESDLLDLNGQYRNVESKSCVHIVHAIDVDSGLTDINVHAKNIEPDLNDVNNKDREVELDCINAKDRNTDSNLIEDKDRKIKIDSYNINDQDVDVEPDLIDLNDKAIEIEIDSNDLTHQDIDIKPDSIDLNDKDIEIEIDSNDLNDQDIEIEPYSIELNDKDKEIEIESNYLTDQDVDIEPDSIDLNDKNREVKIDSNDLNDQNINIEQDSIDFNDKDREIEIDSIDLTDLDIDIEQDAIDFNDKDRENDIESNDLNDQNIDIEQDAIDFNDKDREIEIDSIDLTDQDIDIEPDIIDLNEKDREIEIESNDLTDQNVDIEPYSIDLSDKDREVEIESIDLTDQDINVEPDTIDLNDKDIEIEIDSNDLNDKDINIETDAIDLNDKDREIEIESTDLNDQDIYIEPAAIDLNDKDKKGDTVLIDPNVLDKDVEIDSIDINVKDRKVETDLIGINDKEEETYSIDINVKDREVETDLSDINDKDKEVDTVPIDLMVQDREVEPDSIELNIQDTDIDTNSIELNNQYTVIESNLSKQPSDDIVTISINDDACKDLSSNLVKYGNENSNLNLNLVKQDDSYSGLNILENEKDLGLISPKKLDSMHSIVSKSNQVKMPIYRNIETTSNKDNHEDLISNKFDNSKNDIEIKSKDINTNDLNNDEQKPSINPLDQETGELTELILNSPEKQEKQIDEKILTNCLDIKPNILGSNQQLVQIKQLGHICQNDHVDGYLYNQCIRDLLKDIVSKEMNEYIHKPVHVVSDVTDLEIENSDKNDDLLINYVKDQLSTERDDTEAYLPQISEETIDLEICDEELIPVRESSSSNISSVESTSSSTILNHGNTDLGSRYIDLNKHENCLSNPAIIKVSDNGISAQPIENKIESEEDISNINTSINNSNEDIIVNISTKLSDTDVRTEQDININLFTKDMNIEEMDVKDGNDEIQTESTCNKSEMQNIDYKKEINISEKSNDNIIHREKYDCKNEIDNILDYDLLNQSNKEKQINIDPKIVNDNNIKYNFGKNLDNNDCITPEIDTDQKMQSFELNTESDDLLEFDVPCQDIDVLDESIEQANDILNKNIQDDYIDFISITEDIELNSKGNVILYENENSNSPKQSEDQLIHTHKETLNKMTIPDDINMREELNIDLMNHSNEDLDLLQETKYTSNVTNDLNSKSNSSLVFKDQVELSIFKKDDTSELISENSSDISMKSITNESSDTTTLPSNDNQGEYEPSKKKIDFMKSLNLKYNISQDKDDNKMIDSKEKNISAEETLSEYENNTPKTSSLIDLLNEECTDSEYKNNGNLNLLLGSPPESSRVEISSTDVFRDIPTSDISTGLSKLTENYNIELTAKELQKKIGQVTDSSILDAIASAIQTRAISGNTAPAELSNQILNSAINDVLCQVMERDSLTELSPTGQNLNMPSSAPGCSQLIDKLKYSSSSEDSLKSQECKTTNENVIEQSKTSEEMDDRNDSCSPILLKPTLNNIAEKLIGEITSVYKNDNNSLAKEIEMQALSNEQNNQSSVISPSIIEVPCNDIQHNNTNVQYNKYKYQQIDDAEDDMDRDMIIANENLKIILEMDAIDEANRNKQVEYLQPSTIGVNNQSSHEIGVNSQIIPNTQQNQKLETEITADCKSPDNLSNKDGDSIISGEMSTIINNITESLEINNRMASEFDVNIDNLARSISYGNGDVLPELGDISSIISVPDNCFDGIMDLSNLDPKPVINPITQPKSKMEFSSETHKLAQVEAKKILDIKEQNSSYIPNYNRTTIDDYLNNSEMQQHNLASMEKLYPTSASMERKKPETSKRRKRINDSGLLGDKNIGQKACLLWSRSADLRGIRMMHQGNEGDQLDRVLLHHWKNILSDKEKLKYYKIVRQAEVDKPEKLKKAEKTEEISKNDNLDGIVDFSKMNSTDQIKHIRFCLSYVQNLSPSNDISKCLEKFRDYNIKINQFLYCYLQNRGNLDFVDSLGYVFLHRLATRLLYRFLHAEKEYSEQMATYFLENTTNNSNNDLPRSTAEAADRLTRDMGIHAEQSPFNCQQLLSPSKVYNTLDKTSSSNKPVTLDEVKEFIEKDMISNLIKKSSSRIRAAENETRKKGPTYNYDYILKGVISDMSAYKEISNITLEELKVAVMDYDQISEQSKNSKKRTYKKISIPDAVVGAEIDGPKQNLEDAQNISAYILNQVQSNLNRVMNPAEKVLTVPKEKLERARNNISEENKSPNNKCHRKTPLVAKRSNKKPSRNVLVPIHQQQETGPTDSVLMQYVQADIRSCPPPLITDNPYSLPATDPRTNPDYDKILDQATSDASAFIDTELDIATGVIQRPPPLTPAILSDPSVSDHQVISEVINSIENAAPVDQLFKDAKKVKIADESKKEYVKSTSLDTTEMLNAFIVQDQIMNESNSIF